MCPMNPFHRTVLVAVSVVSTLSSCAHKAAGPMLLEDASKGAGTWTSVALTLAGAEVGTRQQENCLEEAKKAGIQLTASAPVKGTLYFQDSDDYLESAALPG